MSHIARWISHVNSIVSWRGLSLNLGDRYCDRTLNRTSPAGIQEELETHPRVYRGGCSLSLAFCNLAEGGAGQAQSTKSLILSPRPLCSV